MTVICAGVSAVFFVATKCTYSAPEVEDPQVALELEELELEDSEVEGLVNLDANAAELKELGGIVPECVNV